MKRKDPTLAYVFGAAGAALVGYALFKPNEGGSSEFAPSEPSQDDVDDILGGFVGGAAGGTLPGDTTGTGYIRNVAFPLSLRPVGVDGDGVMQYLRPDAADAFNRMAMAARGAGITLLPGSAFRTWLAQAGLYTKYTLRLFTGAKTMKPGYSNHQNGTAIDIASAPGVSVAYGTPAFEWLRANAIIYGWSWDEGQKVNEPWHWRYVG